MLLISLMQKLVKEKLSIKSGTRTSCCMAPGIQKAFHNKFNKSVDSFFPAGPSSKSVHRVACDLTCDQVKREEGPPDRRFPASRLTCANSEKIIWRRSHPGRKSEWKGGFAAPGAGEEGASLQDPHKRIMGMCRWMGSHIFRFLGGITVLHTYG